MINNNEVAWWTAVCNLGCSVHKWILELFRIIFDYYY